MSDKKINQLIDKFWATPVMGLAWDFAVIMGLCAIPLVIYLALNY